MPMFAAECGSCGWRGERFLHKAEDRAASQPCKECGNPDHVKYLASFGMPMRYFESSRPRTIWNMGHEPVTVSSYAEHKAAMKKYGVAEAGQRRGMPGSWA